MPAFDLVNGAVRPADPATAVLEERIAALEGGTAAVAVASGRAALLLAFHALLQPGDEFIAARNLRRGAKDQFTHAFRSFDWQVRWADAERPESFVEALSDRTKAIFIESVGEAGDVAPIEAIANVARRARVPLVVDNALATPYLVTPFGHGADLIVHSTSAFLSGHGRANGGFIVDGGTFDWLQNGRFPALSRPNDSLGGVAIGETFGNFAFAIACRVLGLRDLATALGPADARLSLDGIETLALRMQRHCDNALMVARHLVRRPQVAWVRCAAMEDDPAHALAERYCPLGAGAALTFALAGGHEAGAALVKRLRLFSPLGEVGDARSRLVHPASSLPPNGAGGTGRTDAGLIRASIGLEDVSDIIADLDQALA